MLKLLIVDDEKIIRDGLSNAIDWKSMGIDVFGVAQNGSDALEKCRECMPDIIITDIRMRTMDGFEFIESLDERKESSKIIILSGFDDFEYSKRALKNRVFEYLLKPVKPKVVAETVMRAAEEIKKERMEKEEFENYMVGIKKNVGIIRSRYFGELASGIIYSNDENQDIKKLIQLENIDETEMIVLAVSVMFHNSKNLGYYMLFYEFKEDDEFYVFSGFDGGYGIVTKSDENIEKKITFLQKRIQSNLDCNVMIGVSNKFIGTSKLSNAWDEAKVALHSMDLTEDSRIIYYNKSVSELQLFEKNVEKLEKSIVDSIDRLDKNATENVICEFIEENDDISIDNFKRIFGRIFFSVCAYLTKIDVRPEKVVGDWRIIADKLNSFDKKKDISDFCRYLFAGAVDGIIDSQSLHSSPVVEQITEYIDKNFDKPLSLQELSNEVCLSSNYLSMIFKKETGKKLSDYIFEIRIEKAKDFLRDQNLRAYEISEKVGYYDSRYFGSLFKKATGMSLTEYRKNVLFKDVVKK